MIQSGIPKLDEFLGGGLAGGLLMDVFGAPGTGKTQLAFHMCARAASVGRVLFYDATGSFRPERILEMAGNDILANIDVQRLTNTREQKVTLSKIQADTSLVIIDGITELYSFEYGREGQTLKRNKSFMRYMRALSGISFATNIPIMVTNTVRNIDGREIENMGSAIGHYTHVWMRLSRNESTVRAELETLGRRLQLNLCIEGRGIVQAPQSI